MKLKVLLVGCGEHSAENLIPSLMAIELAEVAAISDPSADALQKAARWFPTASMIQKDNLTSEDIADYDAIVVAAPPQIHVHTARLALAQQKPVFVEKPPAISTLELEKLATTARQGGIITCVGHNLRHSEAAIRFRNAIKATDFGRPVAMEMRYLASKPRGTRWGLKSPLRSFLLSHANHAIDLMIYQMGSLREVVAARAHPDVEGGIAIAAQFIFSSGAVGTLLATSYAPHFKVSATVVSNSGAVASMNGLHEVIVDGRNQSGKRWADTWGSRTLETGFRFAGYQTELEKFFSAIANNTPDSAQPSFDDELAVYSAMDDIEAYIERATLHAKM